MDYFDLCNLGAYRAFGRTKVLLFHPTVNNSGKSAKKMIYLFMRSVDIWTDPFSRLKVFSLDVSQSVCNEPRQPGIQQ